MIAKPPAPKPLIWMGSSKKDLRALPADVVDVFGYALYLAQTGKRDDSTKVLKGFGDASVLEVIESQAGNAYRAVYTVRFAAAVIVLHVFQKKSKSGIETPKPDMDLIEARLKKAAKLMNREQAMKTRTDKSVSHQRGSTNVYADLGYKSADEMLVKAQLVTTIAEILTDRGYTQTKGAALLGIPQPKLSKMLRGQFRGFSERKLMDCLTRLGRDIDIVVRTTPKRKGQGAVSVSFA